MCKVCAGVITGLDICTAAVRCVALGTWTLSRIWPWKKYESKQSLCSTLNTDVIAVLDMCKVCTQAVHCVALFERGRYDRFGYVDKVCTCYHRFGHVQSYANAVHCVALWTRTLLQVWIWRKVCAKAVHCVALWTRALSQVRTCVKYAPKQSIE